MNTHRQEHANQSNMSFLQLLSEFIGLASIIGLLLFSILWLAPAVSDYQLRNYQTKQTTAPTDNLDHLVEQLIAKQEQ